MAADIINLIRQKAVAYARQNGASPATAENFAKTAIAIAWSESNFNPGAVGDNGASQGLFQIHSQGRGKGWSSADLARRKDPNFNIDKSLPELFTHFAEHDRKIGFDRDPAKVISETSRTAQRPDYAAHQAAVQSGVFTTGLSYANGSALPASAGGIISPVSSSQPATQPGTRAGSGPDTRPASAGVMPRNAVNTTGIPGFSPGVSRVGSPAAANFIGSSNNATQPRPPASGPRAAQDIVASMVPGGVITNGFGPTTEKLDGPYAGSPNFNKGVDIGGANVENAPVSSPIYGTVEIADWNPSNDSGWGRRIVVKAADGTYYNFGHLGNLDVKVGDKITPGQRIGTIGPEMIGNVSNGKTTGPHLSFDVWKLGANGQPEYIDPLPAVGGTASIAPAGASAGSAGVIKPKPVTDADAIAARIQDDISDVMNNPNIKPDEKQAELSRLLQLQKTAMELGRMDRPDPTKLAEIASAIQMNNADIAAVRSNLELSQAHALDIQARDNAVKIWQQTGDWELGYATLQETRENNAAQIGLSKEQLQQGWARLGFDYAQADRAYGLDMRREDRADRALSLSDSQFQQTFGLQTRQLESEERREEARLGFDRERLGIDRSRLGLEEQAGLRQEQQFALAAIVDFMGKEIEAGGQKARAAEKALDTLLEVWKTNPTASDYKAGWEPGGVFAQLRQQNGGSYDPGQYKMRAFPVDLKAIVDAGTKGIDVSKAWSNAAEMLKGSGFFPRAVAQLPTATASASGQSATPSSTLPGGSQVGAPVAPTAPSGGSPVPAAPTPPPQSPGLPSGAAPATPQNPVGTPAPSPTGPPDCGPGRVPMWDGKQWLCKATTPAAAPSATPGGP